MCISQSPLSGGVHDCCVEPWRRLLSRPRVCFGSAAHGVDHSSSGRERKRLELAVRRNRSPGRIPADPGYTKEIYRPHYCRPTAIRNIQIVCGLLSPPETVICAMPFAHQIRLYGFDCGEVDATRVAVESPCRSRRKRDGGFAEP